METKKTQIIHRRGRAITMREKCNGKNRNIMFAMMISILYYFVIISVQLYMNLPNKLQAIK